MIAMVLFPCLLLAQEAATYRFDAKTDLVYQVDLALEGDIPILGGQTGLAEVRLIVAVKGQAPKTQGTLATTTQLKEFQIKFNKEPIPLTLDDALPFFPITTLSLSPNGKVLKTDAKKADVPVRIPGLDSQRLPETVFLQVLFPAQPLAQGLAWDFEKPFGESNAAYSVRAESVKDGLATLKLTFSQQYQTLEDEALNVVAKPVDAFAEVSTKVTGTGTVLFDVNRGVVTQGDLSGKAVSSLVELASKNKSQRTLQIRLKSKLVQAEKDGTVKTSESTSK